jgi:hypothetical protein
MDREFTHLESAWLSAEALADEARRDAERAAAEAERAQKQGSSGSEHITVLLTSARERHEEAERKARAAFDKLWSARQGGNSAAA